MATQTPLVGDSRWQEFDKFVRTELREVMMRSKEQYQGRMMKVATESLDLLFGD